MAASTLVHEVSLKCTTSPTPLVPFCILVLTGRRTDVRSLTLPVLSADVTQAEYVGLREMLEERVGRPGADHLMQRQERLENDLNTGSARAGMESQAGKLDGSIGQEVDGVVGNIRGKERVKSAWGGGTYHCIRLS
jgi:hypothetical protein